MNPTTFEEMAKRRGFFWKSCDIYGGLTGLYDYGPLGTQIKKKWENLWRRYFLKNNEYVEIEPTEIMHEKTFLASGHVESFVDPVVKCKKCGSAERADHIVEAHLKETFEGLSADDLLALIKKHNIRCDKCKGEFSEARVFNMMFPLTIGVEGGTKAYLRPETAQGVYVNFKRLFEISRKQFPLGVAIIGKAYRNEISPRNELIRMREFTQAELQIFFDPEQINEHPDFESVSHENLILLPVAHRETQKTEIMACGQAVKMLKLPKFYVYHMAKVQKFYRDVLKVPESQFRFKELTAEEKAFYNKYHWDIELKMAIGWKECGGIHYRTDHDLAGHQRVSKESMEVSINGKRFVPHVLELSFGVDRNIYALFETAYTEEPERTVLKFPRILSPYDCAIFPLVNKEGMPEKAQELAEQLRDAGLDVFYDDGGSIGRRYRRMDEIGTALCMTIDGDTLKDDTVTLRDRDSMQQVRMSCKTLVSAIQQFLHGKDLGKLK
ncbi:MAG: glycine--tRNA ligase [Candidatus Aenigmarchaeota archaeon]|nr:glycine--tRNA ligase [Candidatus Aenigmarchaeota archaeon]